MTNAGATITKRPLTAPETKRESKPPLWAKTLRLAIWAPIAILTSLAITEGLFALAHIGEEEFVDVHKTIGFWHMPHKLVTWRSEGYSQSTTSGDGLRDIDYPTAKPSGVKRIAVMGDSMTEGYQVENDRTYGKVLQSKLSTQDKLPTEVLNFGMSGMSTAQALYLYKEKIAKYHPDVVILAYHIGDNEKNIYAPGADDFMPRPYCFLDDAHVLKTDWHGYDLWMNGKRHKNYDETYWLRANSRLWSVLTKCDLQLSEKAWYAKSKKGLLALFKRQGERWEGPHRITSTDEEFRLPATASDTSYAAIGALNFTYYPVPANLPKKQAAELSKNREITAGWHAILLNSKQRFGVTGSIIHTLNRACAKDNCKLIVAALPAPNNSMLYFRELRMMSQLAHQSGFTFVDVNAAFPSLAPMQPSDLYYNVHFTPKGHEVVADTIYPSLRQLMSESTLTRSLASHK